MSVTHVSTSVNAHVSPAFSVKKVLFGAKLTTRVQSTYMNMRNKKLK